MNFFDGMGANDRVRVLVIVLVMLGMTCSTVIAVADAAFSPERERCEEVMGDGR